MKSYIKSLPAVAIDAGFGVVYAITLVMAMFPPLYLWASGIRTNVLGMPFAITYWIIDAAAIGLALWAKYAIEDIRGELDEDVPVVAGAATSPTASSAPVLPADDVARVGGAA